MFLSCSVSAPDDEQTRLREQATTLSPEEQAQIVERARHRDEWDFRSRVVEGRPTSRIVEGGQWQQQQQQRHVDIEAGLRRQQQDDQEVLEFMTIFSQVLENKELQTILVPSEIFEGNPAQQDGEDKNNDEYIQSTNEDLAPFNWALISARSACQSECRSIHLPSDQPFNLALVNSVHLPPDQRADESKADEDSAGDDDSVILKNEESTPFMSGLWFFHPREEKKLVGGNCAICLDDMQAGEMVVWSETESCPHIFHKKCLVTFLAHNKQAQMRLPPQRRQLDCHPCPTCRQQFVTTCPVVPSNNA